MKLKEVGTLGSGTLSGLEVGDWFIMDGEMYCCTNIHQGEGQDTSWGLFNASRSLPFVYYTGNAEVKRVTVEEIHYSVQCVADDS